MRPRLVVIAGSLEGESFPVEGEVSIGRQEGETIQLLDAAVSRQHCVVRPDPEGWRLEDLKSTHGTLINGVRADDHLLRPGDLVSVGGTVLLYLEGETEPGTGGEVELRDGEVTADTTVEMPATDSFYLAPQEVLARLPASARLARSLHALLEISSALTRLRSVEAVARETLRRALDVVPADRGALLLTDRATDEVTRVVASSRAGAAETLEVSTQVLRRSLGEGKALLYKGLLEGGADASKSLLAARIRSLLCVPLISREVPLGVLYLDTRAPAVQFDEEHLTLLCAVAAIAASALENARHVEWLEGETRRLEGESLQHDMVGESPAMRRVVDFISRVAPTDSTVLLGGESGTGKELAARAIHRNSPRAGKPFVAVNCAVLSEELLASELFGHEKGAFTGAVARKLGKLELADSGTVFLDEVGELPETLQPKLLRVLEEREFERVGGGRPIQVDVRILAATNRDLEKATADGSFRRDLYYRLNVIPVVMPPLCERSDDVLLLARHFAALHGRRLGRPPLEISREAAALLGRYRWPGNVRELANAVERAAVLSEDAVLRPEDLPEALLEGGVPSDGSPAEAGVTGDYHASLQRLKRQLVLDAVRAAEGNVTAAAKKLGLHPNYLHRLIRNLDLREQL